MISLFILAGNGDVVEAAEVNPGSALYPPKTGTGAEDAHIIGAITIKVSRDRLVLAAAEVITGDSPDRPEAAAGAEDPDCSCIVPVIVTGNDLIVSAAEVSPSDALN